MKLQSDWLGHNIWVDQLISVFTSRTCPSLSYTKDRNKNKKKRLPNESRNVDTQRRVLGYLKVALELEERMKMETNEVEGTESNRRRPLHSIKINRGEYWMVLVIIGLRPSGTKEHNLVRRR